MDNRLRFLYYSITELWGRRRRALPGMESRGKHRRGTAGKTAVQPKGVTGSEIIVAKSGYMLSRKAAIAPYVPVP